MMKKFAELWKTIPPNQVAPTPSKAPSPAKQNLGNNIHHYAKYYPTSFLSAPDPHFSDKLRIVISAAPVLR
jgi:hypothetical protein